MSGTLRVLPLGGVGEIGKNMTVVEYDGRIVVVDCGLRFPTADMMGIDLVLPDFTYLREHVEDIEAIVITHGHEDHLGALPWVLRELGPGQRPGRLRRPADGRDGALQARRAQAARGQPRGAADRRSGRGRPVRARAHPPHALDPRRGRRRADRPLGTVLFTGDYKFDQTPVGGAPADVSRLAELGREGLLLLCGDSTNADRPGVSLSESVVGPNLERVFHHCKGRIVVTCFASNIHRVQQVVDAAARTAARSRWSGARCARTSTSAARSGTSTCPRGCSIQPREVDQFPDETVVIISTGSQGEPLSALRRMAYRDHPQVELQRGDTVVFSATPIPGNERAVNETIDRLYQIGCDVVTTRDAPIHASGHGYAEELKLMLNLTRPKYVMPVHGDFKRMLLHGAARRGRRRAGREHLPARERHAAGDRRVRRAPGRAARPRGMVFVDGVDIGDVADVALRDRRMLSGDGILIIVATISEQDGSSVVAPEVLARGVPFLDGDGQIIEELREAVEDSLDRAADQRVTEIDVLESMLHDDLAAFIYNRLKRRPMVLPVVVEV